MKKYALLLCLLILGRLYAAAQCTASAGPAQTLTCTVLEVVLEGSSNVSNAQYSWTGPGGFTSNVQNPFVSEAGEYALTITDPSDGCTATSTTTVNVDTWPPTVVLTSGILTCAQLNTTIAATVTPPNCTFNWLGPNGFSNTQQNPVVSEPGPYTVTVTNPANGCTATETQLVVQDIVPPDITASVSGPITCATPVVTLFCGSQTPNVTFDWIGPNGFASFQQNPSVAQTGTFFAYATAPNGCTASATVEVTADISVPDLTITPLNLTCSGASNGALTANASGGTPPYTYAWNNGVTTAVVTGLTAGTYIVTITDALGCSATASAVLSQPPAISLGPPGTISIMPAYCFGDMDGSITLPLPVGGVPDYTYQWSNNQNTLNLTNVSAGTYTLTITDAVGCTVTYKFDVEGQLAPLFIAPGINCAGGIYPTVSGGLPPYIYSWSNGANTPSLENLTPGAYHLTVTDEYGCFATGTFQIGPGATPCTRIVGRIALDENANCLPETTETPLGSWFLQASGVNGTYYGMSDANGQYSITVAPGDYTVQLQPQGFQPFICQNDIPVSLSNSGDTTAVDFAVQLPDPDCPRLTVDLSTPLLRRCFPSTYYIKYCNEGPAAVDNAYITLELDPFMVVLSSNVVYSSLGNNTYRFDLGTVPPNYCNTFFVGVLVSCNAVLGQTHCSIAHIYPDSTCQPTYPLWSGAHLEVASICATDSLQFILKNVGSGAMTQALDYIVIEDGLMSRQGSAAPLQAGQSMTVSVPATGATWRLEALQEPFSPFPTLPVLSVEGCTNTGTFSIGYVNQFPSGAQGPREDIDCTANVGSYDPNDKQGFPEGYGANHYIRPGVELEYKIRFQNTGTDTAFNVVIRDTLSPWLDPTSIRPGASSHPYRFELAGEGVLIFDFQNILLPDSNVNEPASNGFVEFRILPRTDAPLETDLYNQAAIYFDFNDPIFTNTTQHRLGENFVSILTWMPDPPAYSIVVSPNPMKNAGLIVVNGAPGTGEYQLELVDTYGRISRQIKSDRPEFLIQEGELPPGTYGFRIRLAGQPIGSGKIILVR